MTAISLGRLFVSGREPAAPMAIRDDAVLPFGGFAADVAHHAAAVRAAGVTRGALLSADPYRFLVGLFSLLHAGATVVLPPDGLGITLTELRDRFDVLLCDSPPPIPLSVLPIQPGQRGAVAPGALEPATAMLEFFTSGSTGAAKRVAKPLVMLDREIATLDLLWGETMGRRPVLATVPHRHIFGLTFHLLWPLARGQAFASHVDEHWEALLGRDLADTILVTSPAHLTRLGGISALPPGSGPRRVFTAGAPLRASEAREASKVLGVAPTEIFGSTETGAIATRTQYTEEVPWTPLPGIKVATDGNGRMIVDSSYGPDGMPFVSADRVEMTANGTFHFLGRADRIAKIAGTRVNLARLEDELMALPWVREAAVLVHGEPPERLAAAVVLSDDGRSRLDQIGAFRLSRELRRQLARRLASAWLPKSWRFVDEFARGAIGKRRDTDIRALFATRPGHAP